MFKFNFSLIIFFSFICSFSLFAQWSQTNGPYGGPVSSTVNINGHLFAGTSNGVFLSTNNGTNWTQVNTGLMNTNVYSLASKEQYLFAGTYNGGVFRSTNSGASWVQVGLTNTWVYAFAVSGTNLFAGTYGNGVFMSTNNGESWTSVNQGLTYPLVQAITVSGTNIFAGTNGSGVFYQLTMVLAGVKSIPD